MARRTATGIVYARCLTRSYVRTSCTLLYSYSYALLLCSTPTTNRCREIPIAVVSQHRIGHHGAGSNPAADARAQKQWTWLRNYVAWPPRSIYHPAGASPKGESGMEASDARQLLSVHEFRGNIHGIVRCSWACSPLNTTLGGELTSSLAT